MESENLTEDEFAFDFHTVESTMTSAAARVTHNNCPCSSVYGGVVFFFLYIYFSCFRECCNPMLL